MNKKTVSSILASFKKRAAHYKYAGLFLLIGILLMAFPLPKSQSAEQPQQAVLPSEQLEPRLKSLLSSIDGAGRVEVLLTMEQGTRYTYQTDTKKKQQPDLEEFSAETVLTSGSSGADQPIPISSVYPTYRGAVVICDGADRPTVQYHIVRAVASATGLSSDKISVLKMCHK